MKNRMLEQIAKKVTGVIDDCFEEGGFNIERPLNAWAAALTEHFDTICELTDEHLPVNEACRGLAKNTILGFACARAISAFEDNGGGLIECEVFFTEEVAAAKERALKHLVTQVVADIERYFAEVHGFLAFREHLVHKVLEEQISDSEALDSDAAIEELARELIEWAEKLSAIMGKPGTEEFTQPIKAFKHIVVSIVQSRFESLLGLGKSSHPPASTDFYKIMCSIIFAEMFLIEFVRMKGAPRVMRGVIEDPLSEGINEEKPANAKVHHALVAKEIKNTLSFLKKVADKLSKIEHTHSVH